MGFCCEQTHRSNNDLKITGKHLAPKSFRIKTNFRTRRDATFYDTSAKFSANKLRFGRKTGNYFLPCGLINVEKKHPTKREKIFRPQISEIAFFFVLTAAKFGSFVWRKVRRFAVWRANYAIK